MGGAYPQAGVGAVALFASAIPFAGRRGGDQHLDGAFAELLLGVEPLRTAWK